MIDELVCVAKILGAHGIKGEVKIKTYTEELADIFKYKNIYDQAGQKYILKKVGITKNSLVVKINDISSRDECELLAGKQLFVYREELPKITNEEFYYSDLITINVVNEDMQQLGKVKALHNFGAGELIEIDFIDKRNNNFISFTKENFPQINIKEKYIIYCEKFEI